MTNANTEDLLIPALNALASSEGGAMTMADFATHLETRQGSTDEEAQDSRSPQSRQFQTELQALVSGLVDQGYVTLDGTGGRVQITNAGRSFVGR